MQAVIDGRTPTGDEERALVGLRSTLVALTTAQIEDDTVFRPAEREIWFHLLSEVRDAKPEELKTAFAGAGDVLAVVQAAQGIPGRAVGVVFGEGHGQAGLPGGNKQANHLEHQGVLRLLDCIPMAGLLVGRSWCMP